MHAEPANLLCKSSYSDAKGQTSTQSGNNPVCVQHPLLKMKLIILVSQVSSLWIRFPEKLDPVFDAIFLQPFGSC